MRNYISLALATTPSGLGSLCKHVGVPTRLRIGNRLRRKCSAVAGGEGARTKGAVSKGTICTFQCACKNAKPNIPQKWGCLLLGGSAWWPGGCIARSVHRPRRMYRAPPAGAREGSACGLVGAGGVALVQGPGMISQGADHNAWNWIPRASAEGAREGRVKVC